MGIVSKISARTHTFWHGRIGKIRPFVLWDLRGVFLEAFCHGDNALVDVIDDAALLIECASQIRCVRRIILKLLA